MEEFITLYLRIICTFLCAVHVSELFLKYHQRMLISIL